jgi:chaperonin GroES
MPTIWNWNDRRTSKRFALKIRAQLTDYSGNLLNAIFTEDLKMTVQVTPLHDRVLVRRLEEKETAKGGIIIPDTAKERPQEGEVMAVGAGKIEEGKRIPLDVKTGDRILIGKYTGSDITIDGQEYLILREEEILAKVSGIAKAASGKK